MSNVVELDCITRLDLPPERVLKAAGEAELQDVVIMGYDKDGEEYFASSMADGGKVNWLLDRMKRKLMAAGD